MSIFSYPPTRAAPVLVTPGSTWQPSRSLSESSRRPFIPTSPPIALLSTPSAKLFRHIHPILTASLFYLQFPALVLDPVTTLLGLLPPVAALQVAYSSVCLPTSSNITSPALKKQASHSAGGETSKHAKPSTRPRRRPAQKSAGNGSVASRVIPSTISLFLALSVPPIPIAIICILLGAPLTSHFPHTLLLATHISILAVQPLFYIHGVDKAMWHEILGAALPFDGVWGGTVGCVVGAWFGAVPIPLDWDREWQKWPVTIVVGAYAGFLGGKYAGEYLLGGKRIDFSEEVEQDEKSE